MNWKSVLWYGYWIFILGLNSFFAQEHWYIVLIAGITGFWLGASVRFARLKKFWDRYITSTDNLIKAHEFCRAMYLDTIKTLSKENELLKEGESWKDT